MTKIHVVIPVYNACKYLRSAVDSVLSQPYKGIDIVLVNDGSTDGSDAICNEIADAEERVTVIHQENRGVSAARNAGIQYFLDKETSDKDYIAFLDADDLWAPDVFTEDEALKLTSDVLGYSSYYANETVTRYRSLYAQQDKNVQKNSGIVFWLANGHFGSYLHKQRGLTDTRLANQKYNGAAYDTATKHSVKLAYSCFGADIFGYFHILKFNRLGIFRD